MSNRIGSDTVEGLYAAHVLEVPEELVSGFKSGGMPVDVLFTRLSKGMPIVGAAMSHDGARLCIAHLNGSIALIALDGSRTVRALRNVVEKKVEVSLEKVSSPEIQQIVRDSFFEPTSSTNLKRRPLEVKLAVLENVEYGHIVPKGFNPDDSVIILECRGYCSAIQRDNAQQLRRVTADAAAVSPCGRFVGTVHRAESRVVIRDEATFEPKWEVRLSRRFKDRWSSRTTIQLDEGAKTMLVSEVHGNGGFCDAYDVSNGTLIFSSGTTNPYQGGVVECVLGRMGKMLVGIESDGRVIAWKRSGSRKGDMSK